MAIKKGILLRNLSNRLDDTKYKVKVVGKIYLTVESKHGTFRLNKNNMQSDFGEKFAPWPDHMQEIDL